MLHSFWIPQLGGKRDLIANHTNYLWFTPDSVGEQAWNGFCAEYCGASHANMRFKAFTVTPADFESWAAHQMTPAAFGAVASAPRRPRRRGTPAARPAGEPSRHASAPSLASPVPVGTAPAASVAADPARRAARPRPAWPATT